MDIMQDNSEIVHYEQIDIPIYIKTAKLSEFPNMQALCHWHDDIEFTRVLNGRMNYFVNGKRIELKQNDCIMINARQMHYGYSFCKQECEYYCMCDTF